MQLLTGMTSTEGHVNQSFCSDFLFLAFNNLLSHVLLGDKELPSLISAVNVEV